MLNKNQKTENSKSVKLDAFQLLLYRLTVICGWAIMFALLTPWLSLLIGKITLAMYFAMLKVLAPFAGLFFIAAIAIRPQPK